MGIATPVSWWIVPGVSLRYVDIYEAYSRPRMWSNNANNISLNIRSQFYTTHHPDLIFTSATVHFSDDVSNRTWHVSATMEAVDKDNNVVGAVVMSTQTGTSVTITMVATVPIKTIRIVRPSGNMMTGGDLDIMGIDWAAPGSPGGPDIFWTDLEGTIAAHGNTAEIPSLYDWHTISRVLEWDQWVGTKSRSWSGTPHTLRACDAMPTTDSRFYQPAYPDMAGMWVFIAEMEQIQTVSKIRVYLTYTHEYYTSGNPPTLNLKLRGSTLDCATLENTAGVIWTDTSQHAADSPSAAVTHTFTIDTEIALPANTDIRSCILETYVSNTDGGTNLSEGYVGNFQLLVPGA